MKLLRVKFQISFDFSATFKKEQIYPYLFVLLVTCVLLYDSNYFINFAGSHRRNYGTVSARHLFLRTFRKLFLRNSPCVHPRLFAELEDRRRT